MLDAATQAPIAANQQRHRAGVLHVTHDPALTARWADRTVDLAGR